MSNSKKIVVIGGTGLIGSKAVKLLQDAGHEAIIGSSRQGINAYTGEGLAAALKGADAVIDVSNMISFDEAVIRDFFETSSRNLTTAEKAAGVRHHVLLSIVGTDGLVANPYMGGKQAQEQTVRASGQDYTIIRATQFYEFMDTLVDAYAVDGAVKVPAIDFQPIAADDVAAALVKVALGEPRNRTLDLAGPDRAPFEALTKSYLGSKGDTRAVSSDPVLGYFGASVETSSLVPRGDTLKGTTTLMQWLNK